MPQNRPAIPADIERKVLIAAGNHCAACGATSPLEIAHIRKWAKSKDHSERNLICLCAGCHGRADKERWTQKLLREYKKRPWVSRYRSGCPKKPVLILINAEMDQFDDGERQRMPYALAGFLGIRPEDVVIEDVQEGSLKVTVSIPEDCIERLLIAYNSDPKRLAAYLGDTRVLDIQRISDQKSKWGGVELALARKTNVVVAQEEASGARGKRPLTKSEVLNALAEKTGLKRKQVGEVFDELNGVIQKSLKSSGCFTLPGLVKIRVVRKPATKARKGVNPFTGEEMVFKAKPARNVLKATALKGLKLAVETSPSEFGGESSSGQHDS